MNNFFEDKEYKFEIYSVATGKLKYIFYASDKKIRDPDDLKKVVGNISEDCFFIKKGNELYRTDAIESKLLYFGKNPTKEFLVEQNSITALKYIDFQERELKEYDRYEFDDKFICHNGHKKFEIRRIPLINDKKTAYAIAKENGMRIIDFNYGLRNHEGVVLECIKNEPSSFRYVAQKLKNDKNFVIKALKLGVDYRLLNENLKNDKEIVIASLKNGRHSVVNINKSFLNDIDVMREASKHELFTTDFFNKLDQKIANDSIVQQYQFIKGLQGFRTNDKISKVISDKEVATDFVETVPNITDYFTDDLRDDMDLAFKVAKVSGGKIFNFSKRVQNEYDIVVSAIESSPRILEKVDEKFLKNKTIMENAFNKDLYVLKYDKFGVLSIDKEKALSVVKAYPELIEKIPESLKNNKEIVITAIKLNPYLIKEIPKPLQDDRDVIMAAVSSKADIIEKINPIYLKDKEIVRIAVKGGWLKKVVKIIKEVDFKDYYGNSSESTSVVYGIDEDKVELIKRNFPREWEEIFN